MFSSLKSYLLCLPESKTLNPFHIIQQLYHTCSFSHMHEHIIKALSWADRLWDLGALADNLDHRNLAIQS